MFTMQCNNWEHLITCQDSVYYVPAYSSPYGNWFATKEKMYEIQLKLRLNDQMCVYLMSFCLENSARLYYKTILREHGHNISFGDLIEKLDERFYRHYSMKVADLMKIEQSNTETLRDFIIRVSLIAGNVHYLPTDVRDKLAIESAIHGLRDLELRMEILLNMDQVVDIFDIEIIAWRFQYEVHVREERLLHKQMTNRQQKNDCIVCGSVQLFHVAKSVQSIEFDVDGLHQDCVKYGKISEIYGPLETAQKVFHEHVDVQKALVTAVDILDNITSSSTEHFCNEYTTVKFVEEVNESLENIESIDIETIVNATVSEEVDVQTCVVTVSDVRIKLMQQDSVICSVESYEEVNVAAGTANYEPEVVNDTQEVIATQGSATDDNTIDVLNGAVDTSEVTTRLAIGSRRPTSFCSEQKLKHILKKREKAAISKRSTSKMFRSDGDAFVQLLLTLQMLLTVREHCVRILTAMSYCKILVLIFKCFRQAEWELNCTKYVCSLTTKSYVLPLKLIERILLTPRVAVALKLQTTKLIEFAD